MDVALSLTDASPVYFRRWGTSEVEIVEPATGKAVTLPSAIFRARFVESWNCPPALKEKARGVMPYREWRRQHEAKGRKCPDAVREEGGNDA